MRLALLAFVVITTSAADWPDYRGPNRNGTSPEKDLPNSWSLAGENLLWKAPYGGRSTPVTVGDRVYVLNTTGKGETLQERAMCLDANSGKVLWEHKYSVFLSDVPPHRAAWSAPAADPETGSVYTFGVGGELHAFNRDGKVLWKHSLAEEYGLVTTHGGRTVSPVVEGPLVIVSGVTTGWGEHARAAHRFFAFDKRTGEPVWISSSAGRPYDTTYAPPVVVDIEGTRMFITGGSDGAVHAIKVWTGEPLWRFEMSKRGLNTGPAVVGTTVIVSHSEENLDSSDMGLLAAFDARARGNIGRDQVKWQVKSWQGGFSSPLIDGDRLYQVDNGANLFAFDSNNGKTLWQFNLGTIQKASPVLADGKLYVGSENGRFFILRPSQAKVDVLSEQQLGEGEQIIASPAISNGRVYLVSTDAIYCIGSKRAAAQTPVKVDMNAPAGAAPAHVQVVPAEVLAKPGDKITFKARLFDDKGRFIREEKAEWSLEGLQGSVEGGTFTAGSGAGAGAVKASVAGKSGTARVRVIPPLPWSQDFTSVAPGAVPAHWLNATGKSSVREIEGNKVLVKHADNAFTKRARAFLGPSDWHDYTIEVDVNATEKRRQMGDGGVVAQRYGLTLFGNHQRLELQSWQPETGRTVSTAFPWKANTWYRLKLRVENLPDGKVRAQGKAWPSSEPEPDKWNVERIDPIGNRQGSPGLYADAPFEVFFDNLKVSANR
jgi:outer membrane protein assembly factor BamB